MNVELAEISFVFPALSLGFGGLGVITSLAVIGSNGFATDTMILSLLMSGVTVIVCTLIIIYRIMSRQSLIAKIEQTQRDLDSEMRATPPAVRIPQDRQIIQWAFRF